MQVFFGTTEDGSSGPGQTAGLSNYLSSIGAADLVTLDAVAFDTSDEYPEWVTQDTTPTFGDFYAWMAGGAGVFFDIAYGGGGTGPGEVSGHALALVGLEWDDADGDGVVDQSEGAKFLAIDPLDPSQNYAGSEVLGPPKVTSVSIWQTGAGQELQFSYLQYQGELPFDASNYAIASGLVSGGASISVIPAPAAWIAPLAIGVFRTGRRRFGHPVS